MTPIGIKLSLSGQKEVSDGLKQVGNDVNNLGNAGGKLGSLGQGMEKAALSAGQLKMATQQLPMQFQDIVVSLQAGQQPLTVLLQQGSQLAGSFGGVSAAAKAMAGYVLGLINPITVLGAGVAALGVAYYQGSKEQDAWIKGIVTTGNASGVTTSQLRDYARQIDAVAGTQRQAAAALNDFVSAGVRGGDELRRYTEAAVIWERATGQAVAATAKQFSDLQNAPLQAVLKLNEGTNFLTTSVYEQIKALEEQGNKTEAARVAMDALESAMRDRSKQIAESLGYLERGWNAIASAAKEGWDAMLGVGRKATISDEIARVTAELDKRMTQPLAVDNEAMRASREKGIANLQRELMLLQDKFAMEELNAAAQAESIRQMQARAAFDSKYSKALEGEVTLQQKLAVARKEAEAAGKSEADIKKVLAYVTEEHNKSLDKGGSAAKQAQTSYQSLLSTINQKIVAMQTEAKTGEKLTETEKLRARYQEELNTKGRQYTAQHRERIEAGLALLEQEEQQAIAARELAKAHEEDAKSLERLIQQRERAVKTLEQSVQAARDEEAAAALAAASNITHAEAVAQLAQARAEDAYMQAVANGEAPKTLEFLEREMQARRQLTQLMGQRVVREANKKAADDAAKAWDKVIDGVGDGFYTAIVSDGASALQALQRVAEATILRPMVQYGANNIAGAMGLGSEGSASSLSTAASMVKNGHSIYGALTGSLTYGLGSAAASIGAAIGSTAATSFGAGMAASGFTASAFSTGASMVGAGATSTGLGMMAGAALPWVAGGLAVYSIAKSLFGSNPHDHRGGVYSNATSDRNAVLKGLGLTSGPERSDFTSRGNQAVSTTLGTTIDELLGAYDTLAERATGAARDLSVYAGFATNPKDKDQNAYGYLRIIDAATQDLIYKATHRNSSDKLGSDPAQAFNAFTGEIAGVLVQQLKAADLPGWMRTVFDGMGETVTLESFGAAMQQIQAIDYQFDALGRTMTVFAGLSDDMKTALLGTMGGMEALTAAASSYYGTYYSEAERMQTLREQVNARLEELGVSLGNSLDAFDGEAAMAAFRRNLEQARATGQGELVAAMLAINQEFATAAQYAQRLAGAVGGMGDAMSDTMRDLLAEQRSLQAELLRAQGDMHAYAAAQRDIATTGMTADEKTQWDTNEALRRKIEATEAAARAAAQAQADYARAMEDAARAAEQARQAAISAAMGVVESVIGRDKQYWDAISQGAQKAVSSITSVMDTLEQRIRELYGSVASTARMQAVEGMLYVEQALEGIRAGQSVLSYKLLDTAAAAAQSGIDSGAYVSQFERDRDALRLAAQLSEINAYASTQKSLEEQLLDTSREQSSALQEALEYYRALVSGVDYIGGYSQEQLRALSESVENTQYFYGQLAVQQAQSTAAITQATQGVASAVAGQAAQFGLVAGAVQTSAAQTVAATGAVASAIQDQANQFAGVAGAVNAGTQATQGVASAIAGQAGQFASVANAVQQGSAQTSGAIRDQLGQFTNLTDATRSVSAAITGQAGQFASVAGAVQTSASQTVDAIRGQASQFAAVANAVQQGAAATQDASLAVAQAVLGQYTLLGQVSNAVQTTGMQSAREIGAALAGQASLFSGVTSAIGQGTEATRFVYEAVSGQIAVSTEIRDALLGLASKEAEQSGVPAWVTEEISVARQQLGQLVTIEQAILGLKTALAVPPASGGSSTGGSTGGGSLSSSFNLASEVSIWRDAISSASVAGEASKANLYKTMAKYYTDAQIREIVTKVSGVQSNSNWQALKNLAGMPHYAAGGFHAGGIRLVGEMGPEIEVTGPARYWDANKTAQMLQGGRDSGSDAQLISRVNELIAEVSKLRTANERTAANTEGLPQLVEQFDQVTEGGSFVRSDVINFNELKDILA